MASNYNINDMVNYLNQYTQQQQVPQYQITPEQVQAYANIINLQNQQQDLRQDDVRKLEEAQKQDRLINAVNRLAYNLNPPRPVMPNMNVYGVGGQLLYQTDNTPVRQYQEQQRQQLLQPSNKAEQVQQQIALNEQARQQQIKNAQEMAKFQEALAVANQYNIPIGQAMGLSGKDILGYNQNLVTGQTGIQREAIGAIGDLYNTALKGQLEQQLAEFNANEKLNQQKQEYLYKGLLAIQEGNIQRGIEEMKQAGLNERQQAELLNRMDIAKINAQAQTDAATTRANATRYAADQRTQGQPSYGPLSAGLNNLMFLSPEQQARVMADYDAYTRAIGLRKGKNPQINPQNINTMNNYINRQGDANFQ